MKQSTSCFIWSQRRWCQLLWLTLNQNENTHLDVRNELVNWVRGEAELELHFSPAEPFFDVVCRPLLGVTGNRTLFRLLVPSRVSAFQSLPDLGVCSWCQGWQLKSGRARKVRDCRSEKPGSITNDTFWQTLNFKARSYIVSTIEMYHKASLSSPPPSSKSSRKSF